MRMILEGDPKEIAALVLAVQERQEVTKEELAYLWERNIPRDAIARNSGVKSCEK